MTHFSTKHHNFQGARAEQVYRLIAQNGTPEHPLSRSDVATVTGLTPREVSKAVEHLRRDGMKILASRDRTRGGYWLARSNSEFRAFYSTVTKMSYAALKTLSRMRVPEDQPGLPFEGE